MGLSSVRRFTVVLLAGTASAGLIGQALAAPINLAPAALFPVADRGGPALVRSIQVTEAKRMFANFNLAAGEPQATKTDEWALFQGVSDPIEVRTLSFASVDVGAGALNLHKAQLALRPTFDASLERLAAGTQFTASEGTNTGLDADLFQGRLRISTDLTLADEGPQALGLRMGDDPTATEINTAYNHKFNAKVIDRDRFKWSLAGQMGQIDPRFTDYVFTEPGDKSPALQWSSVSSRMDFGAASVSLVYDDVTREDETESSQKVVLGFSQSELAIYRRDASQFSLDQGGRWLRRTAVTGISADVVFADILPGKVAEVLSPISPFLPDMLAASFEQGDSLQTDGPESAAPRERLRSTAVDLTWDTQLGQTTASFWQRDTKADVEDVRLQQNTDRVVDLSHVVKRGSWRFGGGVSFIESKEVTLASDTRERKIAPHISFAYAPEDFPAAIEVRVGAADARSIVGVDDIPASAKARQLQVSLDLSNFVQDQLKQPEARLKLEYRRQLDDSDSHEGRFSREGDQAVLLTFSTPLN